MIIRSYDHVVMWNHVVIWSEMVTWSDESSDHVVGPYDHVISSQSTRDRRVQASLSTGSPILSTELSTGILSRQMVAPSHTPHKHTHTPHTNKHTPHTNKHTHTHKQTNTHPPTQCDCMKQLVSLRLYYLLPSFLAGFRPAAGVTHRVGYSWVTPQLP